MLIVEKRKSEKYKMKGYKNQVHAHFSTFLFSLFPMCAYIRIWNNNSI